MQLKAGAASVRLDQLAGERLIRFGPVIGTISQHRFESELRRRGIPFEKGEESTDTRSVQAIAALGRGMALLPAELAGIG